ncbi:acid phosphatase [Metschnikowia bicuspidata var. bicuspidata NRRL YB-4993]|uniref:Acid phosphatase n=1 Tax=Metschnikowia bicuspidata var. bicuspidata NRRL YB-4993 TaxID=869754 RepID=A0A1A0H746_9ASCO|nr:acid phosphatase [Metschnikowia bicuspidata var. bicuspidata NRRL YB-4993]OBA19723.1 acid phosphatase [Metschnikowia bicuspidata var. bicuspidata NRRL YB-4993]
MVAISKLVNNGLLLVGSSFYRDLATPQQASVESYNVVRFLGGSGPYVQHPGYGISTDVPPQCTLEQVHLMSRHGERYPSKNVGASLETIMAKVDNYNQTFVGELAFFNDYTYFVSDSDYYEKETSSFNSEGTFAGTADALRHGMSFRSKYQTLFNSSEETLKVFTSNSVRCHETSKYFARGFMGDEYDDESVDYYIIAEDSDMGANSLTPRKACTNYDKDINEDIIDQYNMSFLADARDRIVEGNTNFNLTTDDVENMFEWCAYEINVRGSSPVCDLFTNEEYIRYSYSVDVDKYYSNSFGNNMTATVAAPYLNATMQFMKEETPEFKVLLAFTHDTDLEIFHSALGLVEPDHDLPTDHVPFPSPYSHVQVTPQGARIITEKYNCGGTSYVRYLINDAVLPIKTCQDGPGFSCEMSKYESYIELRLQGKDYETQCGIEPGVPSTVSFLWDYKTGNYTAADIDK